MGGSRERTEYVQSNRILVSRMWDSENSSARELGALSNHYYCIIMRSNSLKNADATSQRDVSITLWKYTTFEALRVTDMNSSHYFMHFHKSYTSHTYTLLSVIERIRTLAPSNVIY